MQSIRATFAFAITIMYLHSHCLAAS